MQIAGTSADDDGDGETNMAPDHRLYREQMEQERQRRDAERAALERAYAISRMREKGRDDLAHMLEAGEISPGEAFIRLHSRN